MQRYQRKGQEFADKMKQRFFSRSKTEDDTNQVIAENENESISDSQLSDAETNVQKIQFEEVIKFLKEQKLTQFRFWH